MGNGNFALRRLRTWLLLLGMWGSSVVLGGRAGWDASDYTMLWGMMLAAWVGGKGWAAWVEKSNGGAT